MSAPHLSRRALLLGLVGTPLAAACSSGAGSTPSPSPSSSYSGAFTIAHRGGSRDWPEMTAYAYEQAGRLPGISAMEVSVRRAKDGTLVCLHDADTSRLGSRSLVVAKSTWQQLQGVTISARETLDPSQPARPLARFGDVLAAWPAGVTMWAEPKSDDAVAPLQTALAARPDVRVVWKRPVNADFGHARSQGWGTFGYVLDGAKQFTLLQQALAARSLDMVGVQKSASDERVAKVVAAARGYGLPTVMWALADVEERNRALRLGCRGLMCSDIKGLLDAPLP